MNSPIKKIPRESIIAAASYLASLPQIDNPEVVHTFSEGVYCRQITVPADVVCMGKIHKHRTLNILLKGKIEIATEEDGVLIMEAPQVFVSSPGMQKVIKTMSEMVLLNIHATEETDVDKLEDYFTTDSFEKYDQYLFELGQGKIHMESR